MLSSEPFAGNVLPGEIGAGPCASVNAYWFNAYSAFFGCDDGPADCVMQISGYQYDGQGSSGSSGECDDPDLSWIQELPSNASHVFRPFPQSLGHPVRRFHQRNRSTSAIQTPKHLLLNCSLYWGERREIQRKLGSSLSLKKLFCTEKGKRRFFYF